MFWIRFLLGGLIIALEPVIAERLGGKLAGLVVVFPTLIVLSLLSIGQTDGSPLVKQAISGAMWGLPALIFFLAGAYVLSVTLKQSYLYWLSGGIVCWFLAAYLILKFEQ